MNKEFTSYTEALALKELGFDEPCFGYYNGQGNYIGEEGKMNSNCNKLGMHGAYCTAPLYQQAFRWFREKGFDIKIQKESVGLYFGFYWSGAAWIIVGNGSYEEAELACLKKLIERYKLEERSL